MPQPELHCPFCEQTSPRAQGLASHIRSRHPKQYPKWIKTPTRLSDATKPAASKAAKQVAESPVVAEKISDTAPVSSPPMGEGNPALDLLKQAHAQLTLRKQKIEAELARFADLTKELETVNTQIEALDKTLGLRTGNRCHGDCPACGLRGGLPSSFSSPAWGIEFARASQVFYFRAKAIDARRQRASHVHLILGCPQVRFSNYTFRQFVGGLIPWNHGALSLRTVYALSRLTQRGGAERQGWHISSRQSLTRAFGPAVMSAQGKCSGAIPGSDHFSSLTLWRSGSLAFGMFTSVTHQRTK
jgi:hypothetical protein